MKNRMIDINDSDMVIVVNKEDYDRLQLESKNGVIKLNNDWFMDEVDNDDEKSEINAGIYQEVDIEEGIYTTSEIQQDFYGNYYSVRM